MNQTRRDRAVRNALSKLEIAERYALEARLALAAAEHEEPAPKPVRVSEADVLEARRLMRLDA